VKPNKSLPVETIVFGCAVWVVAAVACDWVGVGGTAAFVAGAVLDSAPNAAATGMITLRGLAILTPPWVEVTI
jgi:hypothetical protein